MGEINPVTGFEYKKSWDAITTERQRKNRMNQFDAAVHSSAYPHVTYDFPPDPDQSAAATCTTSASSSETTTAILQQLTDLSKTNTDRLNAQEGDSKTLTATVGDLAAQVRSNHEASAAQNQTNREASAANAESIRANREASAANAESIRANAESIRANREASAANAMQIKNMHEQLSSAMNGIKKNASDIVVINDQLDKVKTDVGEISIKLDSVTNDTIVYKESFQTVFGGMRKIVDVLQTPCAKDRDAKVKALHIDTFASQDLATPTATPTNQPGQIFTFGNGDINPSPTSSPAGSKPCAIQERLPDAITSVFAFGRVPDHSTHPYNFSGPLKTCLEDHPEDTPHIFMVGCDMISKPENAPFEVKSDADVQVPSLGVIFSPSVPTLHVGKEWMEQGITMKEIIGFDNDEFRLEWAERTFLGRTVKVLVAADGFPDEDTMNKLTLLVARPSVVEKQKVPKSGEGKVMYRMVSRDEVGEVRMNEDGSIRYASQVAEELRFTKDEMDDDLEWYIEEGKLDPVDREAVRLSALMDMALKQSPLLGMQVLNRKAAMYQLLNSIFAEVGGPHIGSVSAGLENMKVAKVYPSTDSFDYVRDGGVDKNPFIGSVESPKADVFYPQDGEAFDQLTLLKPKGHGLCKNRKTDDDTE